MNKSIDPPLNPYHSPPLTGDQHALEKDAAGERLHWNASEHAVIASGIGLGPSSVIPAAVAGLIISTITWLGDGGSFSQGIANGSLPGFLFVGPMSLGLLVSAVLTCNRIQGSQRLLGWLSIPLFALGAVGTMVIVFRMLNGDPLFGFAKLFAATMYSTFLTSVALIAMFFRVWSNHCQSVRSAHAFEATVLLLACSGGSLSAMVLVPELSQVTAASLLLKLGIYQVVTAMISMAIAFRWLRADWRVKVVSSVKPASSV